MDEFYKKLYPLGLKNIITEAQKESLVFDLARPEDWQEYKKLRIEAITGEDKEMFGINEEEIFFEKYIKSDGKWQEDLSQKDKFFVLVRVDNQVVGLGYFRKSNMENVWNLGSGYITPLFRGQGIGRKMLAMRLNEIRKKGGVKVLLSVNIVNEKSLGLVEFFGFQKGEIVQLKGRQWQKMFLNFDEENLKKIDSVLNER